MGLSRVRLGAGGPGALSVSDRDSWCTPKWLAELIGEVKLDPSSNYRSVIRAKWHCDLASGDDGLWGETGRGMFVCEGGSRVTSVGAVDPVFINPPYSRGQVLRWVKHYRHTRFIFLLRWDPSTEWFAELYPHCTHVWFPDRRINFEPPPGVKSSSNPFPHALYLRDPSEELKARLAGAGYLMVVNGDGPQRNGRADGAEADGGGAAEAGGFAGRFCTGCGYVFSPREDGFCWQCAD